MLLLLLLLLSSTAAAVRCVACDDDSDCSLNGKCDDRGACVCDVPWYGPTCGLLRTVPSPTQYIYGFRPNVSSWGSTILPARRDESDPHPYHLFVAEMAHGGLSEWQTESRCVHAVAEDVAGPYRKIGTVLAPWCHGPVALRDFRDPGTVLLFHVGNQTGDGFLHYAHDSNFNDWRPAPRLPHFSCNMPSAAFHPIDGTLYVICGNGASVASTTDWRTAGTWSSLTPLSPPPLWEDPNLWFDRRGHAHILYHVYSLAPYDVHAARYSGHAYGDLGGTTLSLTFSEVEPFNGTVWFKAGITPMETTYATRERPQLLFHPKSNRTVPVGVTSAVSSQPRTKENCDACAQGACSQCKVTPGKDWTYSILQTFEGFDAAFPTSQLQHVRVLETGKHVSPTLQILEP